MTVGNFGNRLVWAHGYVRSPNVYFYCAKCGVCGDLVRKAGVGHNLPLAILPFADIRRLSAYVSGLMHPRPDGLQAERLRA